MLRGISSRDALRRIAEWEGEDTSEVFAIAAAALERLERGCPPHDLEYVSTRGGYVCADCGFFAEGAT